MYKIIKIFKNLKVIIGINYFCLKWFKFDVKSMFLLGVVNYIIFVMF